MKICTFVVTKPKVINRYKKKIDDLKFNNPAPQKYLYNGASSIIENILLRYL